MRGLPLASSELIEVEVRRAVRRREPRAADRAELALSRLTRVSLDDRLLRVAGEVEPVELPSLDAIHVATALGFGADLEGFITYDHRQAAAARAAGLPVESPA